MNPFYTADKYILVPTNHIDEFPWVRPYWEDMIRFNLLIPRMPECLNPIIKDVEQTLKSTAAKCFSCVDLMKRRMCGDVMLTDFKALSAQVHFSIHPDWYGQSVTIARCGAEQLFRIVETRTGNRLTTLIGVTPVTKKLAIRMLKKVGFVEKGILTNVYLFANDENTITDGLLTQLTPNDLRWD
jgi:hypothetical protein